MLSSQQQYLLSLAREKGFVTLGEAKLVYSSSVARKNALRRLVGLGFLKHSSVPNRFDLVRGDVD